MALKHFCKCFTLRPAFYVEADVDNREENWLQCVQMYAASETHDEDQPTTDDSDVCISITSTLLIT